MQIGVCIRREIVIDCNVDFLDINTTPKNVGSHADTLLEILELLVAFDPSSGQPDCLPDFK